MASKQLSRREFLRLSALTAAGAALASCAPQPTTAPPAEQVQPTTAPPAAEGVLLQY